MQANKALLLSNMLSFTNSVENADIANFEASCVTPLDITVDIDPVQDLHGYDNPWPAGGGKNLIRPTGTTETINGVTFTMNDDGTVNVNGTASALIVYYVSRDLVLKSGSYLASGCPSGGSTSTFGLRVGNVLADVYTPTASSFTVSSDTTTNVTIIVRSGYTANNLVFKPMIQNASVSDTAYAPYSNICPISGWDGAKVTRTGRNLVEDSLVGYNIIANGTFEQTSSFTMQIARVKKGVQYTKTAGDDYFVGGYFTEKPTPSSVTYNNSRIVELANTFTAPIDGYVVFRTASSFATPQLELGSTAHAYEPYTAVIHEIPFSTEVYGGKLNVETGEMVVDRKTDIADGSIIAVQGIYGNGTAYTKPIDGMYPDTSYAYQRVARILSDKLKASPFISIASNQYAVAHSGGNRAVFNIPTCTTEAEYNAWLSENRPQIVYYLATPITLTIDPVEINSLIGENNVWSDTGNVSVRNITCNADVLELLLKTKLIGDC